MVFYHTPVNRRTFMTALGSMAAAIAFTPVSLLEAKDNPILRPIPSSGERLPVIGMGTSRTFDVHGDEQTLSRLGEVLQVFFDNGGALIDSSPMYGAAESVVGKLLSKAHNTDALFAATKVWTYGRQAGIDQMQQSMQRMGVQSMDLMQIHNLRDW